MGNALMTYLNKRLAEENLFVKHGKMPGPVITISREVGCDGLDLAQKIAKRLNRQNLKSDWKVLSKEIFYESARELNLNPEKVRKIFKQTDKYAFDEILNAFNNRSFKSERKIIKSVIDVIHTLAFDGFCIIVGRAGHVIAKDIQNALHLRLIAPLEYRVNVIMKNRNLNRQEALVFIRKVEQERIAFRKAISEDNPGMDYFDLYINRASFNDDDVVSMIEFAVDKKNILESYKFKMEYY